ncbi:MAG: LysM domain-containing protein [Xanthomonadales bacterium]|nr:LysM domain-containing protein [Xanthomonadales bacterium]
MIRKLFCFTFAALFAFGTALAQDVAVRSDHPDEYVVVKGDTLWDISGRFLEKPWQWPAIWQANPQIENPHLIYPGDIISLVYVDGMPQLRLKRGGDNKLSPTVRVSDRDDAIKAIPFERIEPFLRNMHVVSPEDFEGLPYIVANTEERLTATYSDVTYGRGLDAQVGQEYIVARLTNIYDDMGDGQIRRVLPKDGWVQVPNVWDRQEDMYNTVSPWNKRPKNPVGYELAEVSRVRVQQSGEISVLEIIRDRTEVKPGDFILPWGDPGYETTFYPHAMDSVPEGLRILATSGQKTGVGQWQLVSINGGSSDGIEAGHVFAAFRAGDVVDDTVGYRRGSFAKDAEVRLPEVYDGMVMVFRTFDHISYGIALSGTRVVKEFDMLRHPDTRP